ncbi:class I SAM-dependent methyltransferase [Bryobacter aggregatus]|uniref:class I SAM-dependent methyltransferase n=1 Tax=Bryobacter aggregatus TaxID=360054 RepID=UPI000691D897|nr:class I SAM-dependent methyltransferase [Bryobacter aggregatus]
MRERFFAWLMRLASKYHEPLVADRKRVLLGQLSGQVIEIGPGNGVNLQYLPAGVAWTGFEPNAILAAEIAVPPGGKLWAQEFCGGEERFDGAISTLVLCSVADLDATLRQLFASLRPGGTFIFLEHVAAAAATPQRRSQDRWQPLWSCCAGGCQPNRDIEQSIRAAGFVIEQIDRFHLNFSLASPHIAGVARRPALLP